MVIKIKALAASAALALTAACEVSNSEGSIVHIRYDEGGIIQNYEKRIALANRLGQTVVIDGQCMSACTMFLGADRVCVTDRAEFKFHGAIPTAIGETRKNQNEVMSAYYPAPLRQWFYNSGAHRYTIVFMELSLKRTMGLSGVEFCPQGVV